MHEHIDIYCERLGPEFWAEPLNAITNGSFIIAAFMAYFLARRNGIRSWDVYALILLIAAIGVGSTLFHTYATRWAMLADVLPILLFQVGFIVSYSLRVIRAGVLKIILILAGFFGLSYVFGQMPQAWFNGSLGYASALIYLLGLGVYHFMSHLRERRVLLMAGGVFIVSLIFRSIDMALCGTIPFGTHFLWHLLNGAVLYLSIRGLIMGLSSLDTASVKVVTKADQKK